MVMFYLGEIWHFILFQEFRLHCLSTKNRKNFVFALNGLIFDLVCSCAYLQQTHSLMFFTQLIARDCILRSATVMIHFHGMQHPESQFILKDMRTVVYFSSDLMIKIPSAWPTVLCIVQAFTEGVVIHAAGH